MKEQRISQRWRVIIAKAGGLLVFLTTLLVFLACLSYLFSWKVDQSLMSDPAMLDRSVDVHNICGKIGFKTAHALVSSFLGLGIFVLLLMFFEISRYLAFRTMPAHPVRKPLLYLSGAILLSSILSFVSGLVSADTAFGGGLGGKVGYGLCASGKNLIGIPGTAAVLIFLAVLWMVFASRRFADWFSGLFEKKQRKDKEIPEAALPELVSMDSEMDLGQAGETGEASAAGEVGETGEVGEEGNAEAAVDLESLEAMGDGEPGPADSVDVQPDQAGEVTIVEGVDMTAPVEELPPIDPKQDIENFKFPPPVDLLSDYTDKISKVSRSEVETNNQRIRTTLESYRIGVDSVTAIVGPTVTLYKVKLAPGVKSAQVKNVENDIGMALNNSSVRVTILSDSVGIEVANDTRSIVPLKALFNDRSFRESKAELPVAIGYTITQQVKTFDLADTPHLLVAGATKQGKSVGLNVIVTSLLYSKHPSELKFVFIDPKMVEFTPYKKLIRHYLATMPTAVSESEEEDSIIVKKHDKADEILRSLCLEMDERYELMSLADTNKVTDYNAKYKARRLRPDKGHRYLPYLVVVIDEYSDLIMSGGADQKSMSRSVTTSIIRLAQKGRAAGIHVIIATQRPTVDVITGLIKANFPTRIAFRVVSRTDSATILDTPGAEKLIGRGDMLYYEGIKLERVQCAYVDPQETERLTKFIADQKGFRQHYGTPYYLPELPADSSEPSSSASIGKLDPNFDEVARLVVTNQRASTTDVQKRMGMGFARASRVMDQLQAAGIVGPPDGAKPRQILVQSLDELDELLANLDNR